MPINIANMLFSNMAQRRREQAGEMDRKAELQRRAEQELYDRTRQGQQDIEALKDRAFERQMKVAELQARQAQAQGKPAPTGYATPALEEVAQLGYTGSAIDQAAKEKAKREELAAATTAHGRAMEKVGVEELGRDRRAELDADLQIALENMRMQRTAATDTSRLAAVKARAAGQRTSAGPKPEKLVALYGDYAPLVESARAQVRASLESSKQTIFGRDPEESRALVDSLTQLEKQLAFHVSMGDAASAKETAKQIYAIQKAVEKSGGGDGQRSLVDDIAEAE